MTAQRTLFQIFAIAGEAIGRIASLIRHGYGRSTTIVVGALAALVAKDILSYGSDTGLSATQGLWAAFGTIGFVQLAYSISCLVIAAVLLLAISGALKGCHFAGGQFAIRKPTTSTHRGIHMATYWLGVAVATAHVLVWPWLERNAGGSFTLSSQGVTATPLVGSWAFPLLSWVRERVNWAVGLVVSFVVTAFFAKLKEFVAQGKAEHAPERVGAPGTITPAPVDAVPPQHPASATESIDRARKPKRGVG